MVSSSSTESTPPKVPDQVVVNTTPAAAGRVGQAKQNSSDSDTREDSTTVDDPVKAFQEDLQMEGYTGTTYLLMDDESLTETSYSATYISTTRLKY